MVSFAWLPMNTNNMPPIKVYETVVDWEYEQKCTTSYEEECHGYGYHQECEKVILVGVFVADKPVFLCCLQVPKEHCKQVPKKVEKQVPRTKCRKVPDKRCQDFPINVPRKECKEFPKTVCTQVTNASIGLSIYHIKKLNF